MTIDDDEIRGIVWRRAERADLDALDALLDRAIGPQLADRRQARPSGPRSRTIAGIGLAAAILVAAVLGYRAAVLLVPAAPIRTPVASSAASAPPSAPAATSDAAGTPVASSGAVPRSIVPGDPRFVAGTPGGTMTVAYVGPCCVGVENSNPLNNGGDYEWTHLYFEHLLTNAVRPTTVDTNPFSGEYGDLVPELADSWTVSADHLTWTFRLHPGVRWFDGSALTAADVKFSFELCLNPRLGVACLPGGSLHSIAGADAVVAGTRTDLAGVQVVDPLTVAITTASPNALLPDNVQDLFIVQKASVAAIPVEQIGRSPYWLTPNDASGKGGVQGTGPFMLTAFSEGQSAAVSRNAVYWRGRPYLDRIVRREFKDESSAMLAFDAGQIDVTYLSDDDVERERHNAIGTVLPGPSGVDLDISLNPLVNPDFGKVQVRQAILAAIDRASILRNVYHEANPQPLNCLFADPAANPADVARSDYDPARARQLLRDAGVDPATWGEVTFDTYYSDSVTLAAMTAIQFDLAAIGVTVRIAQMDSAAWADRYYGTPSVPGRAVMSLIGGDGGGPSGGYGYASRHSSGAYPKGSNGWTGFHYSNPDLDRALDAVRADFDPVARVRDLQEVCRLDAANLPYLNLWATTRYWIVSNRIGNFVSTPGPGMGNYYKAAEQWYIRP